MRFARTFAGKNTKFDVTSSLATFPIKLYYQTLENAWKAINKITQNTTLEEFQEFFEQSLVRVIINYDRMTYSMITESPAFSFEQLLGAVGGNLGIFIGASFLTFFELVEMAVEIVADC
jgi:hypothetical protein